MCSSASITATTVTLSPLSMLAAAWGQHHAVLLSPLILRNTIIYVVGFAIVPKQQPQSHIPSQAYANYAMGPFSGNFLFQDLSIPTNLLILMSVMVIVFRFQVPMCLPCSSIRVQPLRVTPLQSFRVYPWLAYVPPCTDLWCIIEVHQVPAPCTALIRGEVLCYSVSCPPATESIWWYIQL